jgi:hypothetical protein
MTIHQCPKCELRFDWKTEVDDHCTQDHPEFRHTYPARAVPPPAVVEPPAPAEVPVEPRRRHDVGELFGWLQPPARKSGPRRRSDG